MEGGLLSLAQLLAARAEHASAGGVRARSGRGMNGYPNGWAPVRLGVQRGRPDRRTRTATLPSEAWPFAWSGRGGGWARRPRAHPAGGADNEGSPRGERCAEGPVTLNRPPLETPPRGAGVDTVTV